MNFANNQFGGQGAGVNNNNTFNNTYIVGKSDTESLYIQKIAAIEAVVATQPKIHHKWPSPFAGSTYQGCILNGCAHGDGKFHNANGDIYIG